MRILPSPFVIGNPYDSTLFAEQNVEYFELRKSGKSGECYVEILAGNLEKYKHWLMPGTS
jgi:hypothetical protein